MCITKQFIATYRIHLIQANLSNFCAFHWIWCVHICIYANGTSNQIESTLHIHKSICCTHFLFLFGVCPLFGLCKHKIWLHFVFTTNQFQHDFVLHFNWDWVRLFNVDFIDYIKNATYFIYTRVCVPIKPQRKIKSQ